MTSNTMFTSKKSNESRRIGEMTFLNALAPHAHWILRLVLGSVFLYHGLTKFPALNEMSAMMGMPVVMILMVAVMETTGGALIVIGGFTKDWMTRLGALFPIPVLLGAIAIFHWPQNGRLWRRTRIRWAVWNSR